MSAITKERIELFIKNPLDNGLTRGEQMELARIALASLEAKPIGAFHIAEQQVDGTSDYLKDGEWPIDNGIIEVYAAPPVPVVPAALPENDDEDGHDIDYLEPSEVYALGRTAGWNACRAAMLQSQGNCIKDGWISCSERMPKETGDIIVVSDGIVMSGISYSRRDGFYIAALEYDDDEPIGGVTHWMPLPEPPRLKEL
ncbi:TPA: DUF551 domain-containing protein [Escherichia coli]|nr:DUF551 domain-containing protein [Escherichia coli]